MVRKVASQAINPGSIPGYLITLAGGWYDDQESGQQVPACFEEDGQAVDEARQQRVSGQA